MQDAFLPLKGFLGSYLARLEKDFSFKSYSKCGRAYRPAIKKFFETHRSFINQANNTHGLGAGHNRGKARTNPDAIPELVKNFKRDALGQPF
jgi:hypothetical protein